MSAKQNLCLNRWRSQGPFRVFNRMHWTKFLGADSISVMQTYPVSEDGAQPAYPIASVDNALRLIRLFDDRDSLRLTDACSYLGVAHSTAHRLLAMLIYHGF